MMTAEEEIQAWLDGTPAPKRREPDWLAPYVAPRREWTPMRRPVRQRPTFRTRRWQALVAVSAMASSAIAALLTLR